MTDLQTLFLTYAGTILVLACVWYVLQVVAMWKIFTKAGEAGWKSIIPFYNEFVLFKISWKNTNMAWVYLGCTIIGGCISAFGTNSGNNTLYTIGELIVLVGVIASVVRNFKESKAFGHGTGFGFGLWFLTPIFNLILGFSSDEYKGAQD